MSTPQTAVHAQPRTQPRVRLESALTVAAVAVITLVAAALQLHALGAKSFWTDEGVSAAFTRLDWYNFVRILWRREANMTLYYLLLRGWGQFGDSVAWIRGLSVVPAVAAVPVLYAVGKRLLGTGVGLTSALLLAVNAYQVRYAQEARSYSLVAFLVTLATYFFVRAVQDGRRSDWKWYVASSALAIYAHFFAVLVVAAHWVSLQALDLPRPNRDENTPRAGERTYSPSSSRDFETAAKHIGLWTLPVWVFIATTGAGPIRWIQRPGLHEIYWFLEQFAGNNGATLFWLYLACGVLAVIAAVRAWVHSHRSPKSWQYAVALAWFAVPVLISLLFSVARPVFLPRYLIVSLPALTLLGAAGLLSFRQRWMALPVLALIVWFALGGVHSYYKTDFDILREDFRGAAAYVLEHAQPGDAILFHKAQGRFPYAYYARHFAGASARPTIVSPGHGDQPTWRDFMGKVTPQALDSATRDYRRVWLVMSQNDGPQGEDETSRQIESAVGNRYKLVEARDLVGIRLYLYAP